jgi:hypothetical protein
VLANANIIVYRKPIPFYFEKVVVVYNRIVIRLQVPVLCAFEDNDQTVSVGGRRRVHLYHIFVLAQQQPLEFVSCVLPHLRVTFLNIVCLGQNLIVYWIFMSFLYCRTLFTTKFLSTMKTSPKPP